MKKIFPFAVSTVVLLGATTGASADTSSGALTITGTIESSFSLTVQSAGGTTSGTQTDAASSALGGIAKHGSAPTGFTLARGASNWTLFSMVGVKIEKANSTSADYTLRAQLGSVPESGVNWKLNGNTLSDSTLTTLTSTGIYGSTVLYSWEVVVTDDAADKAFSNSIVFDATPN